ncbi:MAG: hypothetical protein NT045_09650 [Candidatus Aureabacteria bacterium]|nr:hypothetical protein [Candidatus Auribacterota bacterium]
MKTVLCCTLAFGGLCFAGCVNVDLGQASKDWSEVGKSFAEPYKKGGAPASTPASPQRSAPVSR